MSPYPYSEMVDGNKVLAEQENDLNTLEELGRSIVTKYIKQTTGAVAGTPLNQATLDRGPRVHPLYLDSVDVGASTATVIAKHKAANRGLIFSDTAYVSAADRTILGFRQV